LLYDDPPRFAPAGIGGTIKKMAQTRPRKIIAANWKENPKTEAGALRLFKAVAAAPAARGKNVKVVICPPYIFLEEIARAYKSLRAKKNLALGAEDVFWEESGPFTSGVGPKMLASLGVQYVIVGHSERRKWFKETDVMVNKKVKLAVRDGLTVILCVGEPLAIRKKGVRAAEVFIKFQLKKDLQNVRQGNIIIAYEPIWAIGTGRNDPPEDAAAMARFIKKTLAKSFKGIKVLYGGSVNGANARDYVQLKDIDGALVGGASLKADEFKKIIKTI
jgi:triosephosphate isomerase